MRIEICDDDKKDVNFIIPIIEKFFGFYGVPLTIHSCYSGEELLKVKDKIDLLIMDIQLTNQNGMDVVKDFHTSHKNTKILYYSSNIDFAYQTYSAYGDGFIKKPIDIDNLYNELSRVLKYHKDQKLLVPEIHGIDIPIYKNNIVYIKANKRYSYIVLAKGKIECNRSITEWITILKNDKSFELCRRGVIVNLFAVDSVDDYNKIHLNNGETIKLSDKIGTVFIEKYLDFWSDNL